MSASVIQLAAAYGVIFALCGVAVRIQFALYRGFDFICAVAVLAASESFVWSSRLAGGSELMRFSLASTTAVLIATGTVAGWNLIVDHSFRREQELGGGLLILSLGVSTAVVGTVVLLRGPGLRQSAIQPPSFLSQPGTPAFYALCVGGLSLIAVQIWTRIRVGFALDLWAQDRLFASEVGIDRKQLAMVSGLVGGACLGLVGSYFAVAGGSTPEIGLPAFLYGAAAALLLPGNTIGRSMLGGLVLGPLFVSLQLAVAPAISSSILFVLTLGLLLYRGTSRGAQQVR
jgi:branched-subunit amino acid ABC-type transport system permease component